jgi:hypothetical protein
MSTYELEVNDLVIWYRNTSDEGVNITNDYVSKAEFYNTVYDLEQVKHQILYIDIVINKLKQIMNYMNEYYRINIIDKDVVDYVSNNLKKACDNRKFCKNIITNFHYNEYNSSDDYMS